MEPFSPPAAWFWWTKILHPGSLFARGWARPPSKGFSRINKLKEKIIYFYSLSVNYNNHSPAFGNDSQKGIHCHQRATITYKLTNNIVTNNSVARLYFLLTLSWSCKYIYAWHKNDDRKNAPTLLAISMVMQIRRYGTKRITQYGRSRATLDATGRRRWASICPVLPRRMPWSLISA